MILLIVVMLLLDFKAIRRIWREERDSIIAILHSVWNYMKDYRTFISFLLAWTITNGWCYVFIILGSTLNIKWMKITGWSYLAFLWLPTTPEKLITIPLGVGIKKILFKRRKKR